MIVVRKDGPGFQGPAMLLGQFQQRVVQQIESRPSAKQRQLVERTGRHDERAVIADPMQRRAANRVSLREQDASGVLAEVSADRESLTLRAD